MWSHKNRLFFQLCSIITYNLFVQMKQNFTTNVEFNGESSEVYRKYVDTLFRTKDIHSNITRCNLCL